MHHPSMLKNIRQLKTVLERDAEIELAILFGSYAKVLGSQYSNKKQIEEHLFKIDE